MTALAIAYPQTAASAGDVRTLGTALAQPREQIEATFLAVGGRLAEGAGMLNRLTKVFEALPAELQSAELVDAATRLSEVGQEARTIADLFATEQADLGRLVQVVAAAEHPISELRRAVKMMGIVAINARVVAASVVGDGDDFDVFTTDIAKLSDNATTTIQAFTAAHRRLTEEVNKAARQQGQSENADADTLGALAADMDLALDDLARQRAVSVESTAQTGRVSRQIVGRIASAVMALQVGDSTRQRIEHVEAGIAEICDLIDDGTLTQDESGIGRSIIGALQVAQLAAAAEAFEGDTAEASHALRDLAADAGAIMSQSRAVYGETGSGGSSLATLSRAVGHAAKVLRDCEAERGKLEIVATAVLGTVGVLLSHVEAVQEIEANMRLVSLNAAVKCAQLGPRGAALNVIARQLRELTGETVSAAEGAMTRLNEAAGLAQSFGAAANGDTAGRVGQLEQVASASLVVLQQVDKSLAGALSALNRDGPNVIALLGDAAETFSSLTAIAETMRDLQLQLAEQCPTDGMPKPTGALLDAVSAQRKRYTMDAERRIHESLFGKETAVAVAEAEPVSEAAEVEMDDIFF